MNNGRYYPNDVQELVDALIADNNDGLEEVDLNNDAAAVENFNLVERGKMSVSSTMS